MIRAQHRPWADMIFQPYLTWLFKRNFHEIQLLGHSRKYLTIYRCYCYQTTAHGGMDFSFIYSTKRFFIGMPI